MCVCAYACVWGAFLFKASFVWLTLWWWIIYDRNLWRFPLNMRHQLQHDCWFLMHLLFPIITLCFGALGCIIYKKKKRKKLHIFIHSGSRVWFVLQGEFDGCAASTVITCPEWGWQSREQFNFSLPQYSEIKTILFRDISASLLLLSGYLRQGNFD